MALPVVWQCVEEAANVVQVLEEEELCPEEQLEEYPEVAGGCVDVVVLLGDVDVAEVSVDRLLPANSWTTSWMPTCQRLRDIWTQNWMPTWPRQTPTLWSKGLWTEHTEALKSDEQCSVDVLRNDC